MCFLTSRCITVLWSRTWLCVTASVSILTPCACASYRHSSVFLCFQLFYFCFLAVQTVCIFSSLTVQVYYCFCSCPDCVFFPTGTIWPSLFLHNLTIPAERFALQSLGFSGRSVSASIANYSLCFCKSFYSYIDSFSSSVAALTVMCFSCMLSWLCVFCLL